MEKMENLKEGKKIYGDWFFLHEMVDEDDFDFYTPESAMFCRFKQVINPQWVEITYTLSCNGKDDWNVFVGQQTVEVILNVDNLKFEQAYSIYQSLYYLTPNTSDIEYLWDEDDDEMIPLWEEKLVKYNLAPLTKRSDNPHFIKTGNI